MKRILILLLLLASLSAEAQVALYNSRTLFDAFENPSQKAFYTDSSKQFAFNFGFPGLHLNGMVAGSGMSAIRSMLIDEVNDTQGMPINRNKYTHVAGNSNVYLFSFRWFKRVKYQQELGLSWQVRNDAWGKISNESLAIFDTFSRFPDNSYTDIFNNRAYQQSYHQIALSYRENYTKRIALGVKLSYLNGIAYSDARIRSSSLDINRTANAFTAGYDARYRSSLLNNNPGIKNFLPNFKNPGFAITASANFKLKKGWFLMANLKDIGFIHWNRNSRNYSLANDITIGAANNDDADERLRDALQSDYDNATYTEGSFNSWMSGKVEFLANKNFGKYQPNLLLSKNVFYPGGQISLIHNYVIKETHFVSLTQTYHVFNALDIGVQYMHRTPNFEFYIGSDQLFKMLQINKSLNNSDLNQLKGHLSGGFYIGLSAKFGRLMEHPLNANHIPGLEPPKTKPSFFRKIFGKKD